MHHLSKRTAIVISASIISAAFLVLITIPGISNNSAKAATDTNDVQYTSFLDYSPTDVLIEEQGFAASSTYDCSIASLNCSPVASSTTSLIPAALATNTSAQISPDKTEALVPTYNPGASPTETLETIQGTTLVPKATLPPINGLVTNVMWSSDGNVLLLTESDGAVQKYDATTNTLTTITSIPAGAGWMELSPNGEYLAYYIDATLSSGMRTYGVVDTDTDTNYSTSESITYWDLLTDGVRIFAFSPDSTKLLYLDDRSGYETLYEVDLTKLSTTQGTNGSSLTSSSGATVSNTDVADPDGAAPDASTATSTLAAASSATLTTNSVLLGTPITTKKYSMMDMAWENNDTIVFSANRSTPMIWSLYEYNLDTNALTKITDNIAYNQAMEKDGDNIIFQTADANGRMTHLFNIDTKQVSNFNIPGVDQSQTDTTSQLVTEGSVTGAYLPSSTATTTLLVWLHGGPDRQTQADYNSYMSYGGYDWVLKQVQTAGVPVLKLNYPGSIGTGTQYAESIVGGVGTVDASTTMQAIDSFATAHGFKNIYIMGNSYGGYLALKLLTSYPNQIDGVFSASGVTDWESLLTNVPSSIFSVDFNGPPTDANAQLYANASVINNINAIGTQKVILVQGNADTEVPYQQSVLMNASLVAAGKNVDYTTLPGENHIYENPASYQLVCNKAMNLVGLPNSSMCDMGS